MIRTVHRKLPQMSISHHITLNTPTRGNVTMFIGLAYEHRLLQKLNDDLLQPRQEAIDNIMRLSKVI